jgi:hypothetical protein
LRTAQIHSNYCRFQLPSFAPPTAASMSARRSLDINASTVPSGVNAALFELG